MILAYTTIHLNDHKFFQMKINLKISMEVFDIPHLISFHKNPKLEYGLVFMHSFLFLFPFFLFTHF